MRKLYHPKIEDLTVEGILYALSDPVRVQIFIELAGAQCTKNCSTFLNVSNKSLPKSTLSQHFTIMREAGLIFSHRKGVELHNHTRCAELKERFGEMMGAIIKAYLAQQSSHNK
jgi:hypothetical protein